jgi:hypothetical protein
MRAGLLVGLLVSLLGSAGSIPLVAQRAWTDAVWATASAPGTAAIETASDVVTARLPEGDDGAGWRGKPPDPVRVAVDGSTLYLLDRDGQEHALHIVDSGAKYSGEYAAVGGGHYIKSVAPDGASLVLEDGTRWDVDPRQRFAVAGWRPDDLISVRRSTDDPAFAFEVDNTSQDDGTLANRRVR